MEGVVRLFAEGQIGRHGQRHVGALDGNADVVKVEFVQQPGLSQGAFHQRPGGDAAVLRPELPFQGAPVDAYPDGDAPGPAGVRHGLDLFLSPDVARVDADGVDAPLGALQGEFIVEVNVGHQGDGNPLLNLVHGHRRRLVWDGHPDDLAPGGLQGLNLGHGGLHVVSFRIAHGLDGHGRAAAHRNRPHHQLFRHIRTLPA